jgi:enoyl-CoA hydratase/carnithine racemase
MLAPEAALAVGFVDELAPLAEVRPRAIAWAKSLAALPPIAMHATRNMVRAELIALLDTPEARDIEALADRWLSDETQATIRTIAARVKRQPGP